VPDIFGRPSRAQTDSSPFTDTVVIFTIAKAGKRVTHLPGYENKGRAIALLQGCSKDAHVLQKT
jgi:hypothetical protein